MEWPARGGGVVCAHRKLHSTPQIFYCVSHFLFHLENPARLTSLSSRAAAAAPRARSHFYRGKKEKIDARGAFKKQQTRRAAVVTLGPHKSRFSHVNCGAVFSSSAGVNLL
jgi:hypothetical protein